MLLPILAVNYHVLLPSSEEEMDTSVLSRGAGKWCCWLNLIFLDVDSSIIPFIILTLIKSDAVVVVLEEYLDVTAFDGTS